MHTQHTPQPVKTYTNVISRRSKTVSDKDRKKFAIDSNSYHMHYVDSCKVFRDQVVFSWTVPHELYPTFFFILHIKSLNHSTRKFLVILKSTFTWELWTCLLLGLQLSFLGKLCRCIALRHEDMRGHTRVNAVRYHLSLLRLYYVFSKTRHRVLSTPLPYIVQTRCLLFSLHYFC